MPRNNKENEASSSSSSSSSSRGRNISDKQGTTNSLVEGRGGSSSVASSTAFFASMYNGPGSASSWGQFISLTPSSMTGSEAGETMEKHLKRVMSGGRLTARKPSESAERRKELHHNIARRNNKLTQLPSRDDLSFSDCIGLSNSKGQNRSIESIGSEPRGFGKSMKKKSLGDDDSALVASRPEVDESEIRTNRSAGKDMTISSSSVRAAGRALLSFVIFLSVVVLSLFVLVFTFKKRTKTGRGHLMQASVVSFTFPAALSVLYFLVQNATVPKEEEDAMEVREFDAEIGREYHDLSAPLQGGRSAEQTRASTPRISHGRGALARITLLGYLAFLILCAGIFAITGNLTSCVEDVDEHIKHAWVICVIFVFAVVPALASWVLPLLRC